MTGQDKIPVLLAEKGQELLDQLIPKIVDMAVQAGIQNIGSLKEKLPDFCLPQDELKKMLALRNALMDKLNSTNQTIDLLKKVLDPLNTTVTITTISKNILDKSITGLELSIPTLPTSYPGVPSISSIALNTKSILEKTLNKISPKITKAENTISSISIIVDFVNSILLKIIGLFNTIDKYLKGCNATSNNATSNNTTSNNATSNTDTLTPLSDSLNQLVQAQAAADAQAQNPSTLTNYKDFILEVVTEPYSPTVKRVKAVAKNAQGIILLQTPLSFTTTPQVLIEELKLIIDSSNLKAN